MNTTNHTNAGRKNTLTEDLPEPPSQETCRPKDPMISINTVLEILQENYQAAKTINTNGTYALRDFERDNPRAIGAVIETYEDLISIFNHKRNISDLPQPKGEEAVNILTEALNIIATEHYPEDIFLPVTKEEWKSIHEMLQEKFNMPIDRLTGAYGRLLLKPKIEIAKTALKEYQSQKEDK